MPDTGMTEAKESTIASRINNIEEGIETAHRHLDSTCSEDDTLAKNPEVSGASIVATMERCSSKLHDLNRRLEGLNRVVGGTL